MRMLWCLFAACLWLFAPLLGASADAACNPMTYRESQDAEFNKFCGYGNVITRDNNVWVVTEYAEKRFGMPPEWQDEGLKGAELAAFRVEPSGRQRCHKDGENEVCVPDYECVLELYIQSDIDIGISGNPVMDLIPWKSSLYPLGELNPALKKTWENAFGLKGVELLVAGKTQEEGVQVSGYDTTRKKNLTIVTMFLDGRLSLLPPETPRSLRFNGAKGGPHHVELPPSFWRRVVEHHQAYSHLSEKNWHGGTIRDNSLWVYSKDFANRYQMPETGIADDLEGAMAVAYRNVPTGRASCGYFGEPGSCTKSRLLHSFDIYVPASVKLPYPSYDGIVKGLWGDSGMFLIEQDVSKKLNNEINLWDLQYKTSYIYRSNKTARKDPDKWYGWNGGYFIEYVGHRSWKMEFSVVSINLWISGTSYPHDQNYYCFLNADEWSNKQQTFEKTVHVVKFPPRFIAAVKEYNIMSESDEGSVLGIIKEKFGF